MARSDGLRSLHGTRRGRRNDGPRVDRHYVPCIREQGHSIANLEKRACQVEARLDDMVEVKTLEKLPYHISDPILTGSGDKTQ